MAAAFLGVGMLGLIAAFALSLTVGGQQPDSRPDYTFLASFCLFVLCFAFFAASLVALGFTVGVSTRITSLFDGNRRAQKAISGVVLRGRDVPLDREGQALARRFGELTITSLSLNVASTVSLLSGAALAQIAPFMALSAFDFQLPVRAVIIAVLLSTGVTTTVLRARAIRRIQRFLAAHPA